jgi:hypothetical protein
MPAIRDTNAAKPDPIMHCRRQRKHLPDSSPLGSGADATAPSASPACVRCCSGFLPEAGLALSGV